MYNLVPDVITFLKNNTNLSEIWDRYFSPDFRISKDTTTPNPKISIKERWGSETGYHRIQINIRADSISQTRDIAIKMIRELENNYMNNEIKWQEISWGITDEIDPNWNIETWFYFLFYEKDSQ